MFHEPAVEVSKDYSAEKKAKLGVILFMVYLGIYAGFVLIGAFAPKFLGAHIFDGLNMAFVYGMGLIILAAVMGLIYNYFCTRYENKMKKEV